MRPKDKISQIRIDTSLRIPVSKKYLLAVDSDFGGYDGSAAQPRFEINHALLEMEI